MNLLHIRHQGPSLTALGRIACAALGSRPDHPPSLPGPPIRKRSAALPQGLIDDFVRWCAGDPERWRGEVPPWLFPQWGLPLLAATLRDIPWPAHRVVNQGCQIVRRGPLPTGVPLTATAQLVGIEVTERRARMHQRLVTGHDGEPEALVADVFAVVPLARGGSGRPPAVVPDGTRLADLPAEAGAGWQFACLTGDFNPIHWLGPYARAAGFSGVILHGFGTMARAGEALVRDALGGDPGRLERLDVRFVAPLPLPSRVGVFTADERDEALSIAVGPGPGLPACMLGDVILRRTSDG